MGQKELGHGVTGIKIAPRTAGHCKRPFGRVYAQGAFVFVGLGRPQLGGFVRESDFRNKVPIFASSEEFPNIGSELTEFLFTAHEGSQQQDHMKCNYRWFDILIRATASPLVLSFLLVWVALCPGAAIAEDQTGLNMWFAPQVHQPREKAFFANTEKTGVGRTDHAKVEDKRGLFPLRTKGENNEVGKVEELLYRLGANAATVGIESAAMQLGRSFLERVPEQSMEVMRHRFGHLLPEIKTADWLKRVDLDIDLNQNEGPVYSIRTRQPLFQSDQNVDTLFTQLRWGKDFQFGTWRDTTNLGLGYRRLLMDKTLLVGANTFFDRDWRKDHNRFGWGVEARWFGVDIYVNGYLGLSADNTINTTTTEKVLDGGDAYMLFQVPYVPSTRLVGRAFRWDKSSGDKLHGWRAGVEADLTQYSQLQVGATDSEEDDPGVYVQLRVNFGSYGNRPVLLSDKPISDRAWTMRDMSGYTLDRVRRQENMVLERTTSTGGAAGTVTVVVGRS